MSMGLIILLVSFAILLFLGFPIAFCLLGATVFYILYTGIPLTVISQRLFEGMNGFPLLAVPFFLICGQFMLKGKLLDPLIDAAEAFIGHIRGGLAMVNVVVSLPLGSIIGLALADVTSLGSILIPAMKKEGYDADFSAAVTAASSLLGPTFPPSVLMIFVCDGCRKNLYSWPLLSCCNTGYFSMYCAMYSNLYYMCQKKLSSSSQSWLERENLQVKKSITCSWTSSSYFGNNFWKSM